MTLSEALRNLRKPIPHPKPPEPRTRASYLRLRKGQQVSNTQAMVVAGHQVPPGSTWTVSRTTDQGAFLVAQGLNLGYFVTGAWGDHFTRVRKPRAKRGPHSLRDQLPKLVGPVS